MIFQAGNVHESASLFNLKEKKIDMKGSRIRTHDPEDLVYHTNHYWRGGEGNNLSTYSIITNPQKT